jgi:hypothetical protein
MCIYSKVWGLREAAVHKAQLMLDAGEFKALSNTNSGALKALCTLIMMGLEDKIQQVFFSSLVLLETLLDVASRLVLFSF